MKYIEAPPHIFGDKNVVSRLTTPYLSYVLDERLEFFSQLILNLSLKLFEKRRRVDEQLSFVTRILRSLIDVS